MRYRKWTAECRFDNGEIRKIEVLTRDREARLFCGGDEIERLPTGSPKSRFIPDATGCVTPDDYVFDLDGVFVSVRANGKYRPLVTAVDGLARFTFGKSEIITVAVAGCIFVGAILLAILL